MGESQKPHLNHFGNDGRGRIKPPNKNMSTKTKEPTVVAATSVLKTAASERHMEVDDICRKISKRNWRRNLVISGL
jgi:hypothetical protein